MPKIVPRLLRYAIVLLVTSLRKENLPSRRRWQRPLLPGIVLGPGCRAMRRFLLRARRWDLGTPGVWGEMGAWELPRGADGRAKTCH